MNKLQLDDFLPYHLAMSADLISRSLSRVYAKHGLTIPEWRILAQLKENGSLTPSEIGYLANMEKARVSRALVLMDKKDLVVREPDESDKRVSHITLSAKGELLFAEVEPEVLSWNARFADKLGEENYKSLLDSLKNIQTNCRNGSYFPQ